MRPCIVGSSVLQSTALRVGFSEVHNYAVQAYLVSAMLGLNKAATISPSDVEKKSENDTLSYVKYLNTWTRNCLKMTFKPSRFVLSIKNLTCL